MIIVSNIYKALGSLGGIEQNDEVQFYDKVKTQKLKNVPQIILVSGKPRLDF